MRAHTRKRHIEKTHFDLKEENLPMSIESFIKEYFGELPQWAVALRGLRNREGLTQETLGEMLGTPQTNISRMELGKRPIGKNMAKKLGELFKTDYRLFL